MARRKKFSNGVLPYRKSTNIYGDDEPLDDPKKVFLSDSFQEVMTVKFLGFNISILHNDILGVATLGPDDPKLAHT